MQNVFILSNFEAQFFKTNIIQGKISKKEVFGAEILDIS